MLAGSLVYESIVARQKLWRGQGRIAEFVRITLSDFKGMM
jgi:hypothetical protein